jgi:hypothetical protein
MTSIITIAGEQLFAQKAQNNQQLDIDTFIFANVPGQNSTDPIDRDEAIPVAGQQVHTQIVQQVGRINDNVVVYSTVLDSVTGDFDFNWVGLYSSVNNTLVAINHIPTTTKSATNGGVAGNTLNRNFGIEYSGIADLTGITVAPETWQLDFTARLAGMDELTRNLAKDLNGTDSFIDDGFKVAPRTTVNTFSISPGIAYINGLRVELGEEQILIADSYPKFVYVDAYFEGDASSVWKPKHNLSITSEELVDYVDGTGKQHFLVKLATITANDQVEDLRESFTKMQDSFTRIIATMNEAKADKFLREGQRITISERGECSWNVVLASSVAIDGVFFIQCTGRPLLALVYNVKKAVYASDLGIFEGAGQTPAIKRFVEYIHDNKIKGVVLAGQYDVNEKLLTKTLNGKMILVCPNGEAVFNYTGAAEVTHLIRSINCDHVLVKRVTFQNNNLVNIPLDLRKSSAFGGAAGLFDVKSYNAKETTSNGSAVGLQLSGSFAKVQLLGCIIDGVSFATAGQDATGVVLSDFGGVAEVNLCTISNVTSIDQTNTDGMKIFCSNADKVLIGKFLSAQATIKHSIFRNCQDRFLKMQITNFEVYGCRFSLDSNQVTLDEWRGIDAQYGGGNVHHNEFTFGSNISWGVNSALVTFQNLRNSFQAQTSIFIHNKITMGTAGLSVLANLSAEYGNNTFIIKDNPVSGESIKKGFSLRVGNGTNPIDTALINTESINIDYCDNTVEDYSGQDLFTLFDNVDYGDLIYLTIKDNKVKNKASASRLSGITQPQTINGNFSISNNLHTNNRVDWTFDMDEIKALNNFGFGGQSVLSKGTSIGSYGIVSMNGVVLSNTNTDSSGEVKRVLLGGVTWQPWV